MVVICQANVRSLLAPGRLAQLKNLVVFNGIDILCLNETWLKPKHLNSSLHITGFQPPIRHDRVACKGGGVAVYVKTGITAEVIDIPSTSLECIAVRLHFPKRKKLNLINVYRPPDNLMDAFLEELDDVICKQIGTRTKTCIVGDFNAKHTDWYTGQQTNQAGLSLKNFADGHQLYQVITSPTYNVTEEKQSLLDLVFTNQPTSIISWDVLSPVADHCPVLVHLSLKKSPPPKPFTVKKFLYAQANLPALLADLDAIDWDIVLDREVCDAAAKWSNLFLDICSKHIPQKTIRIDPSSKPWYSKHLKYLASCRDRLFRRAQKAGPYSKVMDTFRKVRNLYVSELRAAEKRYFQSFSTLGITSNEHLWWTRAKLACGWTSPRQMATLIVDNVPITSPSDQAEVLNSHFQKQCSAFESLPWPPPWLSDKRQGSSVFQFETITSRAVLQTIRSLPSNKASGPDSISNEMLKLTADVIAEPIACLINKSLSEGVFPQQWKESKLTPVLKPGKESDKLASYRPVALLSCLSKVLERFVHNQLVQYCLTHGYIPEQQFGFLRGRSAEWQLLSVTERWHEARDRRKHIHAVFLDAEKAFDRVDHAVLLRSLSNIGLRGRELRWFFSYLSDRSIRTQVSKCLSTRRFVSSGVPQGSVLGPLLFLIHSRGVSEATSAVSALFADDTMLFRDDCIGGRQQPCCKLQEDLNALETWAEESHLKFNGSKSVDLRIGPNPSDTNLILNSNVLRQESSTKHLGVFISSDLKWNLHLESVLAKVSPYVNLCQRLVYQHGLPSNATKKFFSAFIRPRLEYCSAVWCGASPALLRKLEKMQVKIAKAILHPQRCDRPCDTLAQAHLPTLAWRRREHILSLMWMLCNKQGPPQLLAMLPEPSHTRSIRSLRSRHSLQFPLSNSERHLSSFFCTVIPLWNALPSSVALCSSLASFRASLQKFFSQDMFSYGL